ncbi:AAA family ATPase [Natronoglycomyces albus]|uniref:AAA family ATPase n=1 Tax=Natronoglycomyces albus TaxID=2811108 RepID=A0A895XGG4_9ACTN|nr:AAA family ATPase [Natronoglycomyces albus]QSB04434.1 AAA family ATPase [Natronoglycomyces albus]
MSKILVTGMSGTGKSTVLVELASRGHRVVDTDYHPEFEEAVPTQDGETEQLWRPDRINALLDGHRKGDLYVSACVSNQGQFYPKFDAVVLLSAPTAIVLERVETRPGNDYGKNPDERQEIVRYIDSVEPLLRQTSTHEIDTQVFVGEVADQLEVIAEASRGSAG